MPGSPRMAEDAGLGRAPPLHGLAIANSACRAGKFGIISGVGTRLLMGIGEVGADAGRQNQRSCRLRNLAERVAGMATIKLADASAEHHRLIGGFVRVVAGSSLP
jgi:hypothetical protein